MSAVATSQLPLPLMQMLSASGAARTRDDPGATGEDAWQRAFVSASQGPTESAATVTATTRLFDLNATIAVPAAELVLEPSGTGAGVPTSAPAVESPASGPAPAHQDSAHALPARDAYAPSSARATQSTVRPVPIQDPRSTTAASTSTRSAAVAPGDRNGHRRDSGSTIAQENTRDDAWRLPLARAATLAGPQQVVAAYAEAMSMHAVASDPATSFTLVSKSSITPVRVHVQWRGQVADVWIGLHRRAFEQLSDIRSGIQDWVSARGGVVGQLVCNGERLSNDPVSSSFPGVL